MITGSFEYKSNLSFAAMNFVKRNNYIGVQILLRD